MSLSDPSAVTLYTPYPALQEFANGTFTVNISGTVAVSATATFTGSASLSRPNGLTRLYINQSPVPSGGFSVATYTAADWLTTPPYGTAGTPSVVIGCSIAGDPSTTEISTISFDTITASSIAFTVVIQNPYAGTMTLTNTTLTVKYFTFVPTPAFLP